MPTATISSSRVKREVCARTKHDSVFSKWKVLIGPSHWEDYSLGKEGVERYMTHNLPAGCSCPGLYELGVAAISSSERLRSRKRNSYKIIVVYLGEADNIRTRLQHYGRAGSHLDHGSKIKTFGLERGPGLFKEIFSRGYSILFRWAPMASKKEAEKMESQLLGVFDYAWNRRGNGSCRREDILLKLDDAVKSPVHKILVKLQRWKRTKFGKKVGIKIRTSWPLDDIRSPNDGHGFRLPRAFKFVKSRPRLVPGDDSSDTNHTICGVAMGDGSVCKKIPVDGRKRCIDHKGKKISGTKSLPTRITKATEGNSSVVTKHEKLEITLQDLVGTAFMKPCSQLVRGDINTDKEYAIDRSFSSSNSVSVRKWSEMREGQSDVDPKLAMSKECNVCGVVTADGYVCSRVPVSGRKRCEDHKGIKKANRIDLMVSRKKSVQKFRLSECGVQLEDGSVCTNSPVPARKRCELHKGMRAKTLNSTVGNLSEDLI